jgi:hypothetical protein
MRLHVASARIGGQGIGVLDHLRRGGLPYTYASRERCEALTLSVVNNNAGTDTPG